MLIERRRNKHPNLIQDYRRRHDETDVDTQFHQQSEIVGWARVVKLWIVSMRFEHGLDWHRNNRDELRRQKPSARAADGNRDQRIDNPLAQLNKMLEKRHLTA